MPKTRSGSWWLAPIPRPDEPARESARIRQSQLTKPPGSLGRLETIAEDFAAWQGRSVPRLASIRLCVFAADHGIAAQGVSAFPQAVTAQMVNNFCRGGAAVSVLGERFNADFRVVNLGCVATPEAHDKLWDRSLGAGTADFSQGQAMTSEQLSAALDAGREQVAEGDFELFIGGEMGIGNTTSASSLEAALLDLGAERVVGLGTGIDGATLARKTRVIDDALARHRNLIHDPLQALQALGGFEIAALVGAYIASAQRGIPSLIDGFISTAAALTACRLRPELRPWLLFAHQSFEPGHRLMLEFLEAKPLLALDLRLGEGSGAALAVPVIQSALALHRNMATFSEAGVSNA